MNTAALVDRRQAILDDVAEILKARPQEASNLALDFCRRLVLRMHQGDLDGLRFEMAQKRADPGGEPGSAGNGKNRSTSSS